MFCFVAAAEAVSEVLVSPVNGGCGIVFATIDDGSGAFSPEFEASGVLRTGGKRSGENVSIGGEHERPVSVECCDRLEWRVWRMA